MWMKRSVAASQVTQRNFLRENMLSVRQSAGMTLPRMARERVGKRDRDDSHWPPARYELPTAASLAHRSGTLPLMETQRRLISGVRQGHGLNRSKQQSEKEIQTEDISDEQFLNAALLKCAEQTHSQVDQSRLKHVCSEGDELPAPSPLSFSHSNVNHLRRIASNFELGKMPMQRSQLSVKPTYRRQAGSAADIDPSQLDELESRSSGGSQNGGSAQTDSEPDNISIGSGESILKKNVLQQAIPDVTDVEQELQLDQPLSARTQASNHSLKASCHEKQSANEASQTPQRDQDKHQDQVLLTEKQRISLLEAAQARQRELIWEYNRLPISMSTLRVRNLKIQLEHQLDMIDSDLSTLNLPQVYIRRDQLQQISSISC